jgi:hypothetical protein
MLTLRAARPEDAERLHDQYTNWANQFVLPRSTDELRGTHGLIFLIERGRTILAATGVFFYQEDRYAECGATYVDKELRGYGIQNLFFELRATSVALNLGPETAFTTAISPSNTDSRNNALEVNEFVLTQPFPEQVGVPCESCPKKAALDASRVCCCDYYVMPPDAMRNAARKLLARYDDGRVVLRRGEATLELEVQCRLLADDEQRLAVEEFAEGRDW